MNKGRTETQQPLHKRRLVVEYFLVPISSPHCKPVSSCWLRNSIQRRAQIPPQSQSWSFFLVAYCINQRDQLVLKHAKLI